MCIIYVFLGQLDINYTILDKTRFKEVDNLYHLLWQFLELLLVLNLKIHKKPSSTRKAINKMLLNFIYF